MCNGNLLSRLPVFVREPGDYLTRDGRRVTVHRVDDGTATFLVKGRIWKEFRGAMRPRVHSIWHVSGRYSVFEEHGLDLIEKVESENLPVLPVIFRTIYDDGRKKWEVVAAFPTLPWSRSGDTMTIFDPIEGHAEADPSWFTSRGRPSTEAERAPVLDYLAKLYGEGEPGERFALKVYQRMHFSFTVARKAKARF